MRRSARTLPPGWALAFSIAWTLIATAGVGAQPVPPAPPAPPALPAPPATAGQPLRAQVEARFEVLPVSDGLLLRPRLPMDGIRTLEIRDGELAIDGKPAEADDLERRVGAAATAPVRSLLELDPDELADLFGLSSAPPPPEDAADADALGDRVDREMEARRAEIERQQEEIRKRIEEEMDRRAGDVQRRQEDLARDIERLGRRGRSHRDSDARVVMGTPVHVEKDETTGDVVAIGGGVTVEGEVMGDAVSVGGSEHISGTVNGSAVAVMGTIHLAPTARVMGDVVSVGGTVEREPGAEVMGQVTEVSFLQGMAGGWMGGRGWQWRGFDTSSHSYFDGAILRFIRCVVFVLVLILLAALASVIGRNPLDRVSAVAGNEPWKAGVVGLLAVVLFIPIILIVLVLLAISIVGIPLLILWPFAVIACVFAACFGYLGAAHALARWSEGRFGWRLAGPVTTMVLGIFLLQGAWLMARLVDVVDSSRDVGGFLRLMLLLFWMLVNLCAAFVGIGAVIMARRSGPRPAPAVAAPPPPPPVAPPPTEHGRDLPTVYERESEPALEPELAGGPRWEEPFATFDEPETAETAPEPSSPAYGTDDEEADEDGGEDEATDPGRAPRQA